MQNKRNFLQKMIVALIVFVSLIQAIQPMVYAAIYKGDLDEGVHYIENYNGDSGNFYIYADENDGVMHIIPVDPVDPKDSKYIGLDDKEIKNGIQYYAVSETRANRGGFDPDVAHEYASNGSKIVLRKREFTSAEDIPPVGLPGTIFTYNYNKGNGGQGSRNERIFKEGDNYYIAYYDENGNLQKIKQNDMGFDESTRDAMGESKTIFEPEESDLTDYARSLGLDESYKTYKNQYGGSATISGEQNTGLAQGVAEAAEELDDYGGLGGVLFDPILDFIVSIADTIVNALQMTLMNSQTTGNAGTLENDDSSQFSIAKYLIQNDKVEELEQTNTDATNNTPIKVDARKFAYGWLNLKKNFYYINAKYSPEEIFTNTSNTPQEKQIPVFNINFFSDKQATGSGNGNGEGSASLNLRPLIAGWYVALRNLSIVGLLCVLVYLGIRILISSTAADKAKYKQLIKDWFIGLCLLFTMHYIMAFTVTVVEAIVNGINPQSSTSVTIDVTTNEGSYTYNTNLMGAARFQTQYKNIGKRMPYVVMYIALVVYTVIFTIYYFKRALMMAFLTMIAPLVALTYPIDKVTDGKAQAFDAWLKDYVYNALLQPFHLIIYTIFVSNALNFAKNNPFYMIASLWFILKAESILRSFFGFNKASNGAMEALHTVGLATVLNTIARGPKIKGAANDAGKQVSGNTPIRFNSGINLGELASGEGANTGAQRTSNGSDTISQNTSESGAPGQQQTANSQYILSPEESGQERVALDTTANNTQTKNGKFEKAKQGFGNLYNYARTAKLGSKALRKGIGLKKFATKTFFTASAGALAGAVALASGGDMGAAIAAASAGAGIGTRFGNKAVDAPGKALDWVDNAQATARDIFNGNNDASNKRNARKTLNNDNTYRYIRDSMIKNGRIPTAAEVNAQMEKYSPFLERGADIKQAEKGIKVADSMGIGYDRAALMLAAGEQDEITRSTLIKDQDKYMENTKAGLIQDGYTKTQAQQITNEYYSFLDRYHGVEDHQEKIVRETNQREEKEKIRQEEADKTRRREEQRKKTQEQKERTERKKEQKRTDRLQRKREENRQKRKAKENERQNLRRVDGSAGNEGIHLKNSSSGSNPTNRQG